MTKHRSYFCSLHRRTNRAECPWHTISERALLGIIREDVRWQLARVEVDEGRVTGEIQNRLTEISLDETKKDLRTLFRKA